MASHFPVFSLAKQYRHCDYARHLLHLGLAASILLGVLALSVPTASAQGSPPDPEVGGTTIECTSYYLDNISTSGMYVTAHYSRNCRINNYPACPDQEPPNQGWAGYDLSEYTEVYYSTYSYFSGYFWGAEYTTINTVWNWLCYLGPCEDCPQADNVPGDKKEFPDDNPPQPK